MVGGGLRWTAERLPRTPRKRLQHGVAHCANPDRPSLASVSALRMESKQASTLASWTAACSRAWSGGSVRSAYCQRGAHSMKAASMYCGPVKTCRRPDRCC